MRSRKELAVTSGRSSTLRLAQGRLGPDSRGGCRYVVRASN